MGDSDNPITLDEIFATNDARAGWLNTRLLSVRDELGDFRSSNFADIQWIRRRLRNRVAQLLPSIEALVDLVAFLHEFHGDSTPGMYAAWSGSLLSAARATLRELIAPSGDEALREAAGYRNAWREATGWGSELVGTSKMIPAHGGYVPSPHEVFAFTFGEDPEHAVQHGRRAAFAYGRSVSRHLRLARRQLRLLSAPIVVPTAEWASTYFMLAVKLGTSFFPLLAHRAGLLTARLIHDAAAADPKATGALLVEFMALQTGRINAAQATYERLLDESDADPTGYVLPDAYRTLGEGIYRPYVSLLLGLKRVANGEAVAFKPASVLGEVEDALPTLDRELADLARLVLNRPMRNHEAHEDVVRSAAGQIGFINRNGEFEPLDLDVLREQTVLMRSFLDGVDVAANVWFTILAIGSPPPTRMVRTETLLLGIAQAAAAALTDGEVEAISVKEGTVTIAFNGFATDADLEILVQSLLRQLDPSSRTVRVVSRSGHLLLERQVPQPQ